MTHFLTSAIAFGWLKQKACGTTYTQLVVLMADMGKIFLL